LTLRISPERLLADLEALAQIGGRPDGGVDRVAGSEADLAGRRWLVRRLEEAGLRGWMDEAGNVLGRVAGVDGPWLLAGSHTDTVPAGGRLDGAYGVIAALEALRTLSRAGHPAAARLEVVSFFDEEGVGEGGGLAGSRALSAGPHMAELTGYLELHIEQGPRLEADGLELGVVEGIVGITRHEVRIVGAANHAGTTPYTLRRDAGAAAGRFLHSLRSIVTSVDPEMVANIGGVELLPGAPNVVPGEARLVLELRALSAQSLATAFEAVTGEIADAASEQSCTFSIEPRAVLEAASMDSRVVEVLSQVCDRSGRPWRRLVSGAGHDAGILARHVPAGMLFVPSRDGISHSPLEHTEPELLIQGAQVLLESVLAVLESGAGRSMIRL
jgi:N-carbamoyl-L-amino-acid hydrolase